MDPIVDEYTRRIELLAYCLNNKEVDIDNILNKFKTSESTLRRDLRFFKQKGIQIFTRKQKIVIGLKDNQQVMFSLCKDYLQLKLHSEHFSSQIKELSLITDNYFSYLILITQAISECRVIKIKYRKADDIEEEAIMNPLRLIIASEYDWQLLAVKHGDDIVKTFYVSRIQSIGIKKDYFEKEKQPVKKEIIYDMVFRFTPDMHNEIYDKIWFANRTIETDAENYIILKTRQPITNRLAAWCLTWWDHIEITKPQELKNYIYEMVTAFNKINSYK